MLRTQEMSDSMESLICFLWTELFVVLGLKEQVRGDIISGEGIGIGAVERREGGVQIGIGCSYLFFIFPLKPALGLLALFFLTRTLLLAFCEG